MNSLFSYICGEVDNLYSECRRKGSSAHQELDSLMVNIRRLKKSKGNEIADITKKDLHDVDLITVLIKVCNYSQSSKLSRSVTICIGCLQKLVTHGMINDDVELEVVIKTFQTVMDVNNEVQLKILQSLLPLLTSYNIYGEKLIPIFSISYQLSKSKTSIINNSASATLRQLLISVFNRLERKDNDQDAYNHRLKDLHYILEDLCLLSQNKKCNFLDLENLSQNISLEVLACIIGTNARNMEKDGVFVNILQRFSREFLALRIRTENDYVLELRIMRICVVIIREFPSVLNYEVTDIIYGLVESAKNCGSEGWKEVISLEVLRKTIGKIYSALGNTTSHELEMFVCNIFVCLKTVIDTCVAWIKSVSNNERVFITTKDLDYENNTMLMDVGKEECECMSYYLRIPWLDMLDRTEPPRYTYNYTLVISFQCIVTFINGIYERIMSCTKNPGGDDNQLELLLCIQENSLDIVMDILFRSLYGCDFGIEAKKLLIKSIGNLAISCFLIENLKCKDVVFMEWRNKLLLETKSEMLDDIKISLGGFFGVAIELFDKIDIKSMGSITMMFLNKRDIETCEEDSEFQTMNDNYQQLMDCIEKSGDSVFMEFMSSLRETLKQYIQGGYGVISYMEKYEEILISNLHRFCDQNSELLFAEYNMCLIESVRSVNTISQFKALLNGHLEFTKSYMEEKCNSRFHESLFVLFSEILQGEYPAVFRIEVVYILFEIIKGFVNYFSEEGWVFITDIMSLFVFQKILDEDGGLMCVDNITNSSKEEIYTISENIQVAFPVYDYIVGNCLFYLKDSLKCLVKIILSIYGVLLFSEELNTCFTSIKLLWSISDNIQKRKTNDVYFDELRKKILEVLFNVTLKTSQEEICESCIKTLFRTIVLNGDNFSSMEWDFVITRILVVFMKSLYRSHGDKDIFIHGINDNQEEQTHLIRFKDPSFIIEGIIDIIEKYKLGSSKIEISKIESFYENLFKLVVYYILQETEDSKRVILLKTFENLVSSQRLDGYNTEVSLVNKMCIVKAWVGLCLLIDFVPSIINSYGGVLDRRCSWNRKPVNILRFNQECLLIILAAIRIFLDYKDLLTGFHDDLMKCLKIIATGLENGMDTNQKLEIGIIHLFDEIISENTNILLVQKVLETECDLAEIGILLRIESIDSNFSIGEHMTLFSKDQLTFMNTNAVEHDEGLLIKYTKAFMLNIEKHIKYMLVGSEEVRWDLIYRMMLVVVYPVLFVHKFKSSKNCYERNPWQVDVSPFLNIVECVMNFLYSPEGEYVFSMESGRVGVRNLWSLFIDILDIEICYYLQDIRCTRRQIIEDEKYLLVLLEFVDRKCVVYMEHRFNEPVSLEFMSIIEKMWYILSKISVRHVKCEDISPGEGVSNTVHYYFFKLNSLSWEIMSSKLGEKQDSPAADHRDSTTFQVRFCLFKCFMERLRDVFRRFSCYIAVRKPLPLERDLKEEFVTVLSTMKNLNITMDFYGLGQEVFPKIHIMLMYDNIVSSIGLGGQEIDRLLVSILKLVGRVQSKLLKLTETQISYPNL